MAISDRRLIRLLASWTVICGLIAACATLSDQTEWIQIGTTTEADIVARYGEPDLVQTFQDGTLVIYRPTASKQPLPAVEIPTIQPGPFGTTVTTTKPVGQTADTLDPAARKHDWVKKEIRIRYDVQGIVREVFE